MNTAAGRRFVGVGEQLPDLTAVDWRNAPPTFKVYPSARRVRLDGGTAPRIDRLLRDIYGITRLRWSSPAEGLVIGRNFDMPLPVRAVPSAGARYPSEIYLVTGPGGEVPSALYHYDPAHHSLETVREGDWRAQVADRLADRPGDLPEMFLLLSPVFWRTAFKYGEFGYRLQCLDLGALVAQALTVAEFYGLLSAVHLRFDDDALNALIGLDPHVESVHVALSVGSGERSRVSNGPMRAPSTGPSRIPANGVAAMLPETRALHDASRSSATEGTRVVAPLIAVPTSRAVRSVPIPDEHPDLYPGAGWRRSASGFRAGPLTREQLGGLLTAATARYRSDIRGTTNGPANTILLCAARRVHGIEIGPYHYDHLNHALISNPVDGMVPDVLDSISSPITTHMIRYFGAYFAPAGDYERGFAVYGDRWYRMQNIEAGIIVQRLALAAASLGLASRINCGFHVSRADAVFPAEDSDLRTLVQVFVGLPGGVDGYDQTL